MAGMAICVAASIDDTAWKILLDSPEFKAGKYSLDATVKNLKTETNLPDPELGGEYLWMPKDVDNRWALELSWGIEWPGVYRARNKEAMAKMTAAEKALWTQRAERLAEIKDLLLDYIRCRCKLSLLEELAQNNDTIYRLAEDAARGGEMTVLDLNKIRLEYANIRVAKVTLMDEEAEVTGQLTAILGHDPAYLLEDLDCTFPEIIWPTEQELALIKENAPAVQKALADSKVSKNARKVAKMEAFPSLSLGYKHAYEDGMHFNGATFGISIPILSSRGKQKAAAADVLESEFNAGAVALEVENDATAILKRLRLLDMQIKEIAPIIENADYNAALLKAYKGGVLTLLEYISDRNYFTNAAVELVSLRHNAAKAMALLYRYLPNPLYKAP